MLGQTVLEIRHGQIHSRTYAEILCIYSRTTINPQLKVTMVTVVVLGQLFSSGSGTCSVSITEGQQLHTGAFPLLLSFELDMSALAPWVSECRQRQLKISLPLPLLPFPLLPHISLSQLSSLVHHVKSPNMSHTLHAHCEGHTKKSTLEKEH